MPAPRPGLVYVTGETIAAAARRYDGQGYVYGGTGARPGDWDCSNFASYVLGHDLGMELPGGMWGGPGMPPAVHGPVVMSYVNWSGAWPVPAGQQTPGDLVCWPGLGSGGHMGFVLGQDQMVSALNSQLGTLISPIRGWGPTNQFVFRRVKGTGQGPAAPAGAGGGWADMIGPLLAGLAVGAGALVVIVGAAAAAGLAVAWAAARAVSAGSDSGSSVGAG